MSRGRFAAVAGVILTADFIGRDHSSREVSAMTKKKVVVALGHTALGKTLPEQKEAAGKAARAIADLVELGAEVAITHSNSQQVGMIHTAMNEFGKVHEHYTVAPMSICSAMSQGYIGYDLQSAIRTELLKRGIYKPVCTVLTQVLVDPYDDAFDEPTKVIGRTLTAEEAEAEEYKGNYVTKTERGYRRIVAAPTPHGIIEIDSIRALLEAGQIVIACGGGGIPVMQQDRGLKGASAIVEKDYVCGLMAELLDADELLLLTGVDQLSAGYGTDREEKIGLITTSEARRYMKEEQFDKKTVYPKLKASVDFVDQRPGRSAVITSMEKAKEGYLEKAGTIIK